MAKRDLNRSEEIRNLLKEKPGIKAREIVETLGKRDITVNPSLVYFIKGQMKGARGRRRRIMNAAGRNGDAVQTILKVRRLADEVGGLDNLKAVVDALSL